MTTEPPRAVPFTGWVLRTRSGAVSLRLHPRVLLVGLALVAGVLVVSALTLTTGDYPAPLPDVVRTLFGDGPPGLELVMNRFRVPRLLLALGVGAALGAAGTIFQSVSRNPLGSPDVIGFTTGSATGAILVLLVYQDASVGVATGALVGGLVAAVLVYLLAYRRGVQGFRLILVGIGVSSILAAVNTYLLSRASMQDARNAQLWLLGSLNGRGWPQVTPLWTALAVLLPVALALGGRMAMLEMGDDAARARGVPAEKSRLMLVLTGVALTGVATAAAGPIAFIALAAPQVARRLVRSAGPSVLLAALTGALLLAAADLAGQRLFGPVQLPVGLTSGAVGGVYLMWLLTRQWRETR
ncbi:iron chelate uptake ABC transporter family permease subunit [Actinokineospora sp. NBRC 105648]|uniref:FecCD family ABC transporter permease n=1 Tax=Actinokineospora sp. NBRC 105648 TaxID=3032206 RepID=UPI0024A38C37|nr:iron chelate uptake ABC transporter family permease subunit [Actinokineospora sp. NBRC 105648]GLZ42778.1 ABC transporter permease [Actinokineospora sp. NBRC 105648]